MLKEEIVVASVYFLVPFSFLSVYLIILRILLFPSGPFTSAAYKIMFHLGIADCLQLFFHMFASAYVFFQTTGGPVLNKIVGGMLNASWISCIQFTFLLGLNRFVCICFPLHRIASQMGRYTKPTFALLWLLPFAFFVLYMTPLSSVIFVVSNFGWTYDNSPWSPVVQKIELYSILVLLSICGIMYVLIFIRLSARCQRQKQKSAELRILLQKPFLLAFTRVLVSSAGTLILIFYLTANGPNSP
ncbi:hypothetical protein L596_013791 [Steinernema carpocapsae]|uniref:7TM GPCR serpentine receptor class x (Srx) domain-containing protein n=1 Tax=Steinernema carpocapsae TaxID=34508 RepID=A0A4U5P2E3_STECR|nr:hypothetical protein L596_013791 [Steinernema carpocapsae]